MRLTDTHCHFDFPPFHGAEEESLARAAAAGVEKIVIPAVEASRFSEVLSLAQRHAPLYAALGLHPLLVNRHNDAALDLLEQQLKLRPAKLVAIGETGLDLMVEKPCFYQQQYFLNAQLKLARDYDLPVILHSRRAHDKLAMHLRRIAVPRCGVVHAFAGSLQQAQAFIRLGYAIGVGGTITYPRASKTRKTIAQLPLQSLVLETDAPDMPLNGFQGQPNRPEQVRDVFSALCELRSEPAEEIMQTLWNNTERIFHL